MAREIITGMPKPGTVIDTHARFMYVTNEFETPHEHNIVNLDNGTIEFWTCDMVEFKNMWDEYRA